MSSYPKENISYKYFFTPDEKNENAQSLAQAQVGRVELEDEKKAVIVEEKKPEAVVTEVVKATDSPKTVTTVTTTTVEEKKPTVTFVEEKKPTPATEKTTTVVEVDTFVLPNAVGIFNQYKASKSTVLTLNKDLVTDSAGKSIFKVSPDTPVPSQTPPD